MPPLARQIPRGTLRGSPTVNGSHAVLVSSISINTTTGYTLKRGDLIGFPNQTTMVTADATAVSSAITALIAPPLRYALSNGNAVTWDKPPLLWLIVGIPMWSYEPGGVSSEVVVDLMEVFE